MDNSFTTQILWTTILHGYKRLHKWNKSLHTYLFKSQVASTLKVCNFRNLCNCATPQVLIELTWFLIFFDSFSPLIRSHSPWRLLAAQSHTWSNWFRASCAVCSVCLPAGHNPFHWGSMAWNTRFVSDSLSSPLEIYLKFFFSHVKIPFPLFGLIKPSYCCQPPASYQKK